MAPSRSTYGKPGRAALARADSACPSFGGRVITGDVRRVLRRSKHHRWTHVMRSPTYLGRKTSVGTSGCGHGSSAAGPEPSYWLRGTMHVDLNRFYHSLATTWRAVARCSVPGARLVVGRGSLRASSTILLQFSLKVCGGGGRLRACIHSERAPKTWIVRPGSSASIAGAEYRNRRRVSPSRPLASCLCARRTADRGYRACINDAVDGSRGQLDEALGDAPCRVRGFKTLRTRAKRMVSLASDGGH